MVARLKRFFKTSVIGGLTVILPVAILFTVFSWLFNFITGLLQPITNLIVAHSRVKELLADFLGLLVIVLLCFVVGVVVRTGVGRIVHSLIEEKFLKIAPGYNLIKETVLQILGGKKHFFSKVALVDIGGSGVLMTAFVTDEHQDGSYTVFVPTAPNPTTGLIFHLPAGTVFVTQVSVEEAMRSIISCGVGSSHLIDSLLKTRKNT